MQFTTHIRFRLFRKFSFLSCANAGDPRVTSFRKKIDTVTSCIECVSRNRCRSRSKEKVNLNQVFAIVSIYVDIVYLLALDCAQRRHKIYINIFASLRIPWSSSVIGFPIRPVSYVHVNRGAVVDFSIVHSLFVDLTHNCTKKWNPWRNQANNEKRFIVFLATFYGQNE